MTPQSWRRRLCAAALMVLCACDGPSPAAPGDTAADVSAVELIPVRHPDPDEFKPDIAASLRPARALFDRQAATLNGPALGAAYGKLGLHYQAHQQQDAAAACFKNAILLDGDDYRWPYHLAVHDEETGAFDEALAHYASSLELQPDNLAGATRLGLLHLKLGDLDAAQRSLESVVARDQDHAAALAGLADIANELGDYEKAAALYRRALEIDPKASQLNYRLGLVYRKLGDVERARAALAGRGERIPYIQDPLLVVMQAHTHPPDYYVQQADGALAKNDLRQAARLYSLALMVSPTDAQALVRLGEVLLAVKKDDAARARFEQLVEAHPDMAIGHYYLGLCDIRAGQKDPAIAHMREALRLDPKMQRASRAMEKLTALR